MWDVTGAGFPTLPAAKKERRSFTKWRKQKGVEASKTIRIFQYWTFYLKD